MAKPPSSLCVFKILANFSCHIGWCATWQGEIESSRVCMDIWQSRQMFELILVYIFKAGMYMYSGCPPDVLYKRNQEAGEPAPYDKRTFNSTLIWRNPHTNPRGFKRNILELLIMRAVFEWATLEPRFKSVYTKSTVRFVVWVSKISKTPMLPEPELL